VRAALTTLLVLLATLALGACGSDTPPEDEVREAAIVAGKSEDPKQFCRQLVSARLVDEVFDGDLGACLKSNVVEENPGRPVVKGVVIPEGDETTATVAMTFEGGESDGVTGHLRFIEEDDEWKLDRFETDYLRSVFDVGIAKVDEGAVSTPEMKRCVSRELGKLADGEIRDLTFDTLTDEDAAGKKIIGLAENCPAALADYVADELLVAFTETGPDTPAYRRCVHDELIFFLQILDITPDLLEDNPSEATVAALQGLSLGVEKNCGGD
jgi:hypothetical protein